MSVTTKNMTVRGQVTVGSIPTLLDTYSGAAAAYSLRKLRAGYTGAAVRVRRSSDSTEQNIGFSNGNLDETSLLSFCGSGSGFVTKWYDQSGNARDAAQSTASSQPRLVNAGIIDKINSIPALYFNGANYLASGFLTTLTQPNTIFINFYLGLANPNSLGVTLYDATVVGNRNTIFLFYNGNSGKTGMYAGSEANSSSTLTGLKSYLFSSLFNSTSSYTYSNGVLHISGDAGTQGLGSLRIGMNIGSNYYYGNISELIIYNSNQSTSRTAIESNINSYYSIY